MLEEDRDPLEDAFPRCSDDGSPLEPMGEPESAYWWCPTCGRSSISV